MRRHGTGELVQPLEPGQQPGGPIQVIEETAENGLMATLRTQFMNVHKKMENLEALVTAVVNGPRGPLDHEYSAAWVESSLHQFEKEIFEKTALKMGYPPNSVTMEPEMTEQQQASLTTLTNEFWDATARVGVGGEYREFGAVPGENMPYPMNVVGRYAATSGLDIHQRGLRVWNMAQTFQKMGIEFDDPLVKKEPEEENVEGTEEKADAVGKDGEEIPGSGAEEVSADVPEAANESMGIPTEEVDIPVTTRPQDKAKANYMKIVNHLRQSMSEIDKDVSSLENDYDAFLQKQQNQNSQPTPSTPPPSQEASP